MSTDLGCPKTSSLALQLLIPKGAELPWLMCHFCQPCVDILEMEGEMQSKRLLDCWSWQGFNFGKCFIWVTTQPSAKWPEPDFGLPFLWKQSRSLQSIIVSKYCKTCKTKMSLWISSCVIKLLFGLLNTGTEQESLKAWCMQFERNAKNLNFKPNRRPDIITAILQIKIEAVTCTWSLLACYGIVYLKVINLLLS